MFQIPDSSLMEFFPTTKDKPTVITGAEALIVSLLAEGVDIIFGYPGGAIMPFYDALYSYKNKLKHYLVRHEQGAVHAAQGYARISNKIGVCISTSGPGATNLITGISDALMDSTPIICITGQAFEHLLGTDAFQETDIIGISMPITKWNFQITSAEEIPLVLSRAFFIAKYGRPGPVLIDITKNAQQEKFSFSYRKCKHIRSYSLRKHIPKNTLLQATQLIDNAKKPLILAGQGVILSKAEKILIQFAEKTGIPVVNTLLGLSSIPHKHPLYMGYLGMHGNYAPNVKTNEADLLIAIGMRFDDRVTGTVETYAKQAKKIHIDIDPAEINKIIPVDIPIISDAKFALSKLVHLVRENKHEEWIQEFKKCDCIEYEKVISKNKNKNKKTITMTSVVQSLTALTKGEAIITADVGQHQMIVSRYYKFNKIQSFVTSGGLGTMGFSLPAAIGAKIAAPHREVIAIMGDGGFQMTLQELGMVMQYGIAIKILILNNNFLGMVRQWQEMFFKKRYSFVDLQNPNFLKIADAYQLANRKVSLLTELNGAIEQMLSSKSSFFLEVVVEKQENVFPMILPGDSVSDIRPGIDFDIKILIK